MIKDDVKKAMLAVLDEQDDTKKEEWYASDYTFAEFGIELLAKYLEIDLNSEDESNEKEGCENEGS